MGRIIRGNAIVVTVPVNDHLVCLVCSSASHFAGSARCLRLDTGASPAAQSNGGCLRLHAVWSGAEGQQDCAPLCTYGSASRLSLIWMATKREIIVATYITPITASIRLNDRAKG